MQRGKRNNKQVWRKRRKGKKEVGGGGLGKGRMEEREKNLGRRRKWKMQRNIAKLGEEEVL